MSLNLFPVFIDSGMKTVAYLGVSTGSQDLANQKMTVLDYGAATAIHRRPVRRAQVSSRKNPAQRGIENLLSTLAAEDRLIVSELSRLGRSLGQVIRIVDELVKLEGSLRRHQGGDPLRGKTGHADQGDGRAVRAVRRG